MYFDKQRHLVGQDPHRPHFSICSLYPSSRAMDESFESGSLLNYRKSLNPNILKPSPPVQGLPDHVIIKFSASTAPRWLHKTAARPQPHQCSPAP